MILLQQNQEIEVDITTTVVEEIAFTEEVSFIHKKAVFFINANEGLQKRVSLGILTLGKPLLYLPDQMLTSPNLYIHRAIARSENLGGHIVCM